LIKSGTMNTTAFTLPAGYRPGAQGIFGTNSNGGFGSVEISNAGAVTPTVGANGYVSLDTVCFLAEA
jgi:hypothetical protein